MLYGTVCHTEAKDRGEYPPALKQNSCGVFNDRRPTKICKSSQMEKNRNRTRKRTKSEQREPDRIPAQGEAHGEQRNTGTDVSNRHGGKTFQSNEQSELGSGQTLVPGGICWDVCRPAARTRAIQRPYAYPADAFGRPGSMEEDLYNG